MSPLHLAALSGNIEIIQLLVTHGADIFATNSRGETPLHLASGENNIQAVNILLNAGNNVSACSFKFIFMFSFDVNSTAFLRNQGFVLFLFDYLLGVPKQFPCLCRNSEKTFSMIQGT